MSHLLIGREKIALHDHAVPAVTEAVRNASHTGTPLEIDIEDALDGRVVHILANPATPIVLTTWKSR